MEKGSGTRSGLLWEVERLLNECDELPQVLLMENVPQVHGKKNIEDFEKWIEFLKSKGYSNYWKDLNAKDYGVAQNRNRCFMVSLLGCYDYEFPQPIPLTKKLKDYLEEEVEEKYYINNEKAQTLIDKLIESGTLERTKRCKEGGSSR
jgi:DNA (cytosine-5)-methyltransferase 1